MLRASAAADPSDSELPKNIAIMDNDITKGDYGIAKNIPIETSESEKTAYVN